SPECLKKRTQQFANDRQREHDRASEQRDRDFERGVEFERPHSQFRRCGNRGPEREASHEAGKNQRRRPNRIAKRQTAQSQPERLKNQRADSRKKKKNRKNRQSHEPSVILNGV